MEILEVGEKLLEKEYEFRENAFGIVDLNNGQMMLVYTEKDRNHSLPGGGVEPGESPLEAIKREFVEEAGYKVKNAEEIVQAHCYWNWRNNLKFLERFTHIFVVELDETSKTVPLEDWHTRVFVDYEDVINLIPFPYQKAGLKYYFEKYKH